MGVEDLNAMGEVDFLRSECQKPKVLWITEKETRNLLEVPVANVCGNFFRLKRQFILNRVTKLKEKTNIIYEVTL